MSDEPKCEVCDGEKDYPVIDRWGVVRFLIVCPMCHGSGVQPDGPDQTRDDQPPP